MEIVNLVERLNLQEKLVIAQMALDEISINTIIFYAMVKDLLDMKEGSSCAEIARHSYMSPQAASRHLARLEMNGYVTRHSYRSWKRAKAVLKDRDLQDISKAYRSQKAGLRVLARPA